jgi:hypothetical protein
MPILPHQEARAATSASVAVTLTATMFTYRYRVDDITNYNPLS